MLEQISKLISEVTNTPEQNFTKNTTLNSLGLNSSLGLSFLRSVIERKYKIKIKPLKWSHTISDLENIISGNEINITQTKEPKIVSLFNQSTSHESLQINIGSDIEHLDSMPETINYEDNTFYQSHFTESEINYCKNSQNSRLSFLGIFCAKEAIKKSHETLINIRMSEIKISHDSFGRPIATLLNTNLDKMFTFKISISHSKQIGFATCITLTKN